jgi:hypothetical protein
MARGRSSSVRVRKRCVSRPQNQALLGFVRLRVTVEDPRFADQRQEFRIAFDIGNDIEQPLR